MNRESIMNMKKEGKGMIEMARLLGFEKLLCENEGTAKGM